MILQNFLTVCASLLISYAQKIPRQDFAQFVTDPSYENRKYHGTPILQTFNFEKDYQQSLIACARECSQFKEANRNCKAFNLFQKSSPTYVCELLGHNFCETNSDKDLTIIDQDDGIIWERSRDSGDPCLGSDSSCQNKGRLGCTGSNCKDNCVQNCRDFDEFVEVTLWPSGESSREIQARCHNNEICLLRLNLASNCVKDQSCAYVMELTALNTLITTVNNYKLQLTMVTVGGTKFEAFYNNFTLDMAQYFLNITFPNLGFINTPLSVTLPSLSLTNSLTYVKNFIEAEINKIPDLCCGTKESEKSVKRDKKQTENDEDTDEGDKEKSKNDKDSEEGDKKKSKDDEDTDEGDKKKCKTDKDTEEGDKKKSENDEDTDEGDKKKSKDDKDTEEGDKKKSKDDEDTDEGDKKKQKSHKDTEEGDKKKTENDEDTDEGDKKKSKDDKDTEEGDKKKTENDKDTGDCSQEKWFKLLEARKDLTSLTMVLI